jgi:hypothetical protein
MKKRFIGVLLVFLLVLSTITFATADTVDNCAGFFGSVKCFLWGISNQESISTPLGLILGDPQVEFNPDNRAGMSWWDRSEAVTGK